MAELGRAWSLATSYDIVFLHSLLASLSQAPTRRLPCTALPFKKVGVRQLKPDLRRWLSAVNILLIREKCRDDLGDGDFLKGKLGLKALASQRGGAERVVEESGFPMACPRWRSGPASSSCPVRSPARAKSSPVSWAVGRAYSSRERPGFDSIIVCRSTSFSKKSLGALIYLKDAHNDLAEDRRKGRFNALEATSDSTRRIAVHRREYRRLTDSLERLSLPPEEIEMFQKVLENLAPPPRPISNPRSLRPRLKKAGFCEDILCYCFAEACCHSAACGGSACSGAFESSETTRTTIPTPPPPEPQLPCPACSNNLVENTYGGVAIDECWHCKGIWLDKGELEQLADKTHFLPDRLRRPQNVPTRELRPEGTRPCPRCGHTLQSQLVKGVRLDMCSDCQGLWLDQGELNQLLE